MKGHCHIFPYKQGENGPKEPKRTKDTVCRNAEEVVQRRNSGENVPHCMGIKGPSWLMLLPHFNCVDGVAIDYMHGILLGVQKLLLRLWFSNKFKTENFSLFDKSTDVNQRLKNIKPTLDVRRMPVDVAELKHWKASEYRVFLLYFGLPILHGILDSARFQHYMKFVFGIHTLLKTSISLQELRDADTCIQEFVRDFAALYSARFLTLNIHQCLHLADEVRNLGPLYNYSCFPFEDKNGHLLKLIHGARHVDSQVVSAISMMQKLPELQKTCIQVGTREEQLCKEMLSKDAFSKGLEVESGIFILGGIQLREILPGEFSAISQRIRCAVQTGLVKTFNRIFLRGSLVYGVTYRRMVQRDNATVKYQSDGSVSFGRVQYFIQYVEEAITSVVHNLAVIKPLNLLSGELNSHILPVHSESDTITVIPITAIQCLCLFVDYIDETNKHKKYVCQYPNRVESD